MNVIFTIRYFHPFVGGTEKQALTLASHLVAKGVDITILTSRFQKSWQSSEIMRSVKVVRLCSPKIKMLGAIIFLTCLAAYLTKHRREYAIIHTFQIGYTSFLSIILGRILGKRSLLKLASSGSGGDIERAKKTVWGNLFLYAAKKASRIIAVSTTVEKELLAEKVAPVGIATITNAVDLSLYDPHANKNEMRRRLNLPERRTIIFTGRLSPEKGVDVLVRSFAGIIAKQACQLLIIATGPEINRITHLIKSCRVSDSVVLISIADEVAPYLAAADLFVLPSRFEGLSNALLEAMACGLPVISTRVGGSNDVIDDGINGLLVEIDSERHLQEAMERILNDREFASTLGENARKTMVARHDLGKITDAYVSLYRDLQSI